MLLVIYLFFLKESFEIQKKTCTRWINWRLGGGGGREEGGQEHPVIDHQITDILFDLRSGTTLLRLLSRLTGTEIAAEAGTFRLHKLANMAAVVGVLQRERARVQGLDTARLVEGDPGQTLALCWALIYRYCSVGLLSTSTALLGSHLQVNCLKLPVCGAWFSCGSGPIMTENMEG